MLTVLPMPADVHEIYPFPGKAYGNKTTCQIQALSIVIGQTFSVCANCVLNVYYICTIRYVTSPEILNRRVLPICFAVSCVVVFPAGFLPLFYDLFNPRPHEPYCLIGSYPEDCNMFDDIECISKDLNPHTEYLIIIANTVLIGLAFLMVFISMFVVVLAVFKSEMTASKIRIETETRSHAETQHEECEDEQQDDDQQEQRPVTQSLEEFKETVTCGRVALMYIAAFFITWIWTLISCLGGGSKIFHFNQDTWDIIGYAKLLCLPLQGFFNSLIFIYHKAHIIRKRSTENITFLEGFTRVIFSPKTIPTERYVTSIDIIDKYFLQREEEQAHRDDMEAHNEHTEADHNEIEIHRNEFESVEQFNLATDISSTGINKSEADKIEPFEDNSAPAINFNRHEPPLPRSSDGMSYGSSSQSWYARNSLLSGFSSILHSSNSAQKDND